MFNLFKKEKVKLIVGLGNPGKQYENTRHNFGFMALNFLREKLNGVEMSKNKKFNAEISEVKKDNQKIILAKPLTFMNNSGEAVAKIAKFYKINPENITVIHDDIDIDFGKIKTSINRGSAGHNGVKSIIDVLKTQNFSRIRLGIGKNDKIPGDKYVLMPFSKNEMDELNKIFEEIKI